MTAHALSTKFVNALAMLLLSCWGFMNDVYRESIEDLHASCLMEPNEPNKHRRPGGHTLVTAEWFVYNKQNPFSRHTTHK